MRLYWLCRVLLASVVALLAAVTQIRAEDATLVGTVKDVTGAIIAESTVTVRHVETNTVQTALTNEQGDYRVPLSRVGLYQVSAKSAGFKTTVVSDLIVQIGQTVRLDMVLQLGEVAESVIVEARAPLVHSETSSLSEVMDNRRILELPLNGREFLQLAALTPGVSSRNPSAGSPSKGGALEVNGGRSGHNQFRLDGVDNTDNHYNELAAVPPIDSIQEFQMIRNLYSAEFGRAGGAVLDVRLRSGTNQIHGGAYEFLRNSYFDARNFFAQTKPAFRFNQFGGTVGAPIFIPRVYNGVNRTFFFFNYEGFRQSKGITQLWNMPTALERQGDFSQSPVKPKNIYTNAPFSDNKIPVNLMSPLGLKLMNLLPLPNAGDPIRNFVNNSQQTNDWTTFVTRIDHQISQNRTLSGSYVGGTRQEIQPNINTYTARARPQNGYAASIGLIQSFSPRVVMETHLGYTRLIDLIDNADKTDYATQIGWPLHQKGSSFYGFPRMSIKGPLGQFNYFGVDHSPFGRRNNAYNVVNALSVNRGQHYLKMGVDLKRQQDNWVLMGSRNFFLNTYSGNVWADLDMGLASSVQFMPDVDWMYLRRSMWGTYIQDDWKVNRRLTLNLGFRYDVNTPYKSKDKRMATFDPQTGQLVFPEGAPLSDADKARLQFPYRIGGPPTGYDIDWGDYGPRFGLAFRPLGSNSLVIRGGYGIFFAPPSAFVTAYTGFVPPWQARIALAGTPASPAILDNVSASYFQSALKDTGSVLYVPYGRTFHDLRTKQWNFAIEKEIVRNLALEVGYVGSAQNHVSGLIDGQNFAQQNIGKPTYPGFNSLSLRTSAYNADYHALQISARKAYSFGLSFSSNFTWSKALNDQSSDDASSIPNYNDYRQIWGRADFDVRYIFNFSGIYELPLGRKRPFLSQANGFVNAVLGGWKLNYILQANSGYPFSLSVSGAASLVRPDVLPGKSANLPPSQRSIDRWFDPSVFTLPASRFGNLGKNVMDGPGYTSLDLGIAKVFDLSSERHKLEFRTELFNALNHPNFFFTGLQDVPFNVPGANRPSNVRDPRSIQLALKYNF